MEYEMLIEKLKQRNFKPTAVRLLANTGTNIIGVEVYCPSLLKVPWMETIGEIAGNEFNLTYFSNDNNYIYIKRKEVYESDNGNGKGN